jgi:hypothetical protein
MFRNVKSVTKFENRAWPCEWCKNCDRRIVTGFIVIDELWSAVVGDPGTCWCLTCFDEEAQRKEIRYSMNREALFHVSWSDAENDPDTLFPMAGRTRT